MYILRSVSLCAIALASLVTDAVAQGSDRTVKVHSWPLDAANPKQLAEISYNPNTLTSSVVRYSKPEGSPNSEDLVRVGMYDAVTSDWRGIVTSAASFDNQYQQRLLLHVDESGEVYHVGFAAQPKLNQKSAKKGKNGGKEVPETVEQLLVEIVKPAKGPSPILNNPVVLSPEGKLPEPAQEKSFFQK